MQIQRSFKGDRATGTLFLVPTPIGNRDDMSYRMIQALKEVDLIAAEDTRNTGLLLKHFEIRTPQTSFTSSFRVRKGLGPSIRCWIAKYFGSRS